MFCSCNHGTRLCHVIPGQYRATTPIFIYAHMYLHVLLPISINTSCCHSYLICYLYISILVSGIINWKWKDMATKKGYNTPKNSYRRFSFSRRPQDISVSRFVCFISRTIYGFQWNLVLKVHTRSCWGNFPFYFTLFSNSTLTTLCKVRLLASNPILNLGDKGFIWPLSCGQSGSSGWCSKDLTLH